MKKVFSFILAAMLLVPATSKAQTEFSVGADLVSSYVWRGVYNAGASFQPSVALTAGNFSIGAWGSTNFVLAQKEVDLFLSYSIGGLSVGLTDYWWSGEGALDYFQLFKKDANSHLLELNLGYSFEFGLSLSLNTMLAGSQDKYIDDAGTVKRSFTTYFEAGYDFSVGDVNLTAALGFSPWNKTGLYTGGSLFGLPSAGLVFPYAYATDEFAVNNISLKAAKEITITDSFSLPVYGQLIFNPAIEDAFLVFGITF
ncbi:MAG: hypothetical protein LBR08_10045 [Bacteroidales bacterium]|jgi:hypothetical protein|nr:hypothetical protein [Bacteroidales bacterium]